MAEDNKPAAAPASAPAQAPNANTVVQRNANQAAADAATRQADAANAPGNFKPAVGASPTPKHPGRSSLITNPEPAKVDEEQAPDSLPSTTIAEMAAGRAALEKNKPVAEALEDANRRREGGETRTQPNPVDATTRTSEVSNKA